MFEQSDKIQRRLVTAVTLVFVLFCIGTVGFRCLAPPETASDGTLHAPGWLRCVYMTVISLTTVGYGEAVPVQNYPHMMIFTAVLLVVGIGGLTYAFGALTALIVEGALTDAFWRRKMNRRLEQLSQHYLVCGAGGTSITAVRELQQTKRPCVVIDSDAEQLKALTAEMDVCVLEGDATDDELLQRAGIDRAKGLLASLPTDKDNLFLVITAKQLNSKLRIVAKIVDATNEAKFRKAGADALASPQAIGGLRLVSELIRPSVVSFLDLMLRESERSVRIEEVQIGDSCPYAGRSLRDISFRQKFSVQVLALVPPDSRTFDYNPEPEQALLPGMTLIVLGDVFLTNA